MADRGGFVVLHRKVLDSWLWTLPVGQRMVAIQLLLEANWKPTKVFRGSDVVTIPRGSCIVSRSGLAERAGVSVQTVRTALENLESAGFLTKETTRYHTVISITNYRRYQDVADSTNPSTHQPPTNHQPTTNPRPTHDPPTVNQPSTHDQPDQNKGTREPGNKGTNSSLSTGVDEAKRSRRLDSKYRPHEETVRKVLGKLSERTGVAYQVCNSHAKLIVARIREDGASEVDLRMVVWDRCNRWLGTDQEQYLRPSTLFRAGHWPEYLAQAKAAWGDVPVKLAAGGEGA